MSPMRSGRNTQGRGRARLAERACTPGAAGADGGGRAEPSPNGGNGVIRATTRRQPASNAANPHRSRCDERQSDLVGPAVAPAGMAAVPVGGGSSAPGHTDGATAVQNSPSTLLLTACAGQNSPCSPKMAQFDAFCPCRANFLPLSPPTSHAGRTFSCARHDNIATLKPTTPLLTPNRGPLKPASPLHPKNAPKTPISHPQRRHRFQPHTDTSKQRRRRFQTTDPAGLQGQAAVPVGDCGARPDNEPTPRTTRRHTRHRRCGGRRRDGRAGCGARGRRRGLAGLRGDAPSEARCADGSRAGRRPRAHQAARPNNTPRGARNTSGATRYNTRRGQLAGGRALRRPEHQRRNTPHRHNKTAQPHRGRAAQTIREGQRRITTMSGSPRPLS